MFTHLRQANAEYYLRELGRVLSPAGVAVTTWFLFDKRAFPMMQDFQNALMINEIDPTNAVIFAKTWLAERAADAGLVVSRAVPPSIRGFQWVIYLQQQASGRNSVEIPEDRAPFGVAPGLLG